MSGHRVSRRFHWLSPKQVEVLARRCRAEGVTLTAMFLTAFAEVLGAWSGQSRFLLNLPVYDRENLHKDVGALVGDFVNLVLLEVELGPSFGDSARGLQRRLRSDVAHDAYTGLDVLRDLSRARGRSVLAPVVFTSAFNLGELFCDEARQSFGQPEWTMSQNPQVWLDFQVTERDGGIYLNWDAVDELFQPGVLSGMFEAYAALLSGLADGDWAAGPPDLLPRATREVRARVNDTAGPALATALHSGFWDVVRREPQRVALIGESGDVSYRQLADGALRVAGALRDRGAGEGDLVAVSLPKGAAQLEAVLGVLAIGGGYVPVGADQPVSRRSRICASAGVALVVGEGDSGPGVITVSAADIAAATPARQPVFAPPDALAYVIYTSGSTGEPKGVEMTHAAAMNTIADINERYGVSGQDRVLAVSALDFDLSVYDIFGLLSAGGALVLIGEDDRREAYRWAELVRRHGVTVWNTVPLLLDMLLVAADGELPGLRLAMVSGDWVGLDLPGRFARQCGGRFVALGGATEGAIWSNAFELAGETPAGWRSVPYGFPLRNQRYRVVDGRGRDCPDWSVGELWIGGAGVARGYRGDPERSAEKFVEHEGVRWYRTGDLGRYWPDGTLEFLGRADFQVKVRGHRIELGEIEAALRDQPGVTEAVAVAVGKPPRLAAAVVADAAAPDGISRALADRLPAYMVPERIMILPALPLSANGKVDRKAIGALLAAETAHGDHQPPSDPVEALLAELWAELPDADGPVSREQNFFALGGDSLHAVRMLARMAGQGLRGGTLRDLFESPKLADFARRVRLGEAAPDRPALAADRGHRHDPFPATDVQRAYLLGRGDGYDLGGVGSHWYWEFDGTDIDLARLEEALNLLIARHDMLRAVFERDGSQRVLPEVPRFTITRFDAASGSGGAGPGHAGPDDTGPDDTSPSHDGHDGADTGNLAALGRMRDTMSHRISDPYQWPQLAVAAASYGAGRTRVAFSFDFIILDALSIMLVLTELSALYADPSAELTPPGIEFRDYVLGAEAAADEGAAAERYWSERIDAIPPAPQLPLRMDPAELRAPRFTRRELRVEPERWSVIAARARAHGLTPITVLATAYARVLSAWSAQPGLTLNLTLFDRRDVHPDIGRVLGDFTSLLLVPYQPREEEPFADAARRLQGDVWSGMEHRAVSAIWVVREMARRSRRVMLGMPVVLTSALGLADGLGDQEFAFGEPGWGTSQTPQVWLDFQVMERAGALQVNWDAVEELFCAGVLDGMLDAYEALLDWLATADDWLAAGPDPRPGGSGRLPDQVEIAPVAAPATWPGSAGGDFAGPGDQPPAGVTEKTLARLWSDLLGVADVARNHSFFMLGGDSLKATQLLSGIRREFAVEMSLRQLVAASTVADMAATVDTLSAEQSSYEEGAL